MVKSFTFVASWGVSDEAPVSWSLVFRALSNALVPVCSLRLNNLRIPSYVLVKQLILNQLLGNRRKTPGGNGRSAVIDPMTVQNVGKRGICRNWLILKAEHKPEMWRTTGAPD